MIEKSEATINIIQQHKIFQISHLLILLPGNNYVIKNSNKCRKYIISVSYSVMFVIYNTNEVSETKLSTIAFCLNYNLYLLSYCLSTLFIKKIFRSSSTIF